MGVRCSTLVLVWGLQGPVFRGLLSQHRRAIPESGQGPALLGVTVTPPRSFQAPSGLPPPHPTPHGQHKGSSSLAVPARWSSQGPAEGAVPDPPSRSPGPLSPSPPRPPVSTHPLTDLPARSKAPGPREGDGGQRQDARLVSREWTGGRSPSPHRQPHPCCLTDWLQLVRWGREPVCWP